MRIDISNGKRFAYRVAGLAIHEGKFLLHRAEFDNFWALPGGSCEFFEESPIALKREFAEEVDAEISVNRLLWVVENFFEWDGVKTHEIGLYYGIDFVGDSKKFYEKERFTGEEIHMKAKKPFKLQYAWFSLESLEDLTIKPIFLTESLKNIPTHTECIIQHDQSSKEN